MSTASDEDKRKHLEFIQNIITRMNSNSFMIKGWTITIVSALLALFASTKEQSYLVITLLPIIIFWWLDTRYLQMERKFRCLYKKTIADQSTVASYDLNIDETSIKDDSKNKFWSSTTSEAILPFYLFLFVLSVLSLCFLDNKKDIKENNTIVKIQDTLKLKILNTRSKVDTIIIK